MALAVSARAAAAQVPSGATVRDVVTSGGAVEQYLRALQVAGVVPLHPWSVRGFSPREIDSLVPRDTTHPWARRLAVGGRRLESFLIAPATEVIYNTGFPFGYNDGPVWAGRGLTTVASVGAGVRLGPLSVVVYPEAFRAENQRFALQPNGYSGLLAYNDPTNPITIDQPQRFGDGAYQRIDPGQSTVRLDVAGGAIGFSTANQVWGPATAHPLLLGNNAAGFPHVFVGTSAPVNLHFIHFTTRLVYGRLDESPYAVTIMQGPPINGETRRLMSGAVGAITVRGLPGFEIGAARFFHVAWPENGITRDEILRPFNAILKGDRARQLGTPSGDEFDNQLASIFARWVFPGAVEVYGEYAREDYNVDEIDLLAEPDQNAAYMIGMQRAWRRTPSRLLLFRAEVLNARVSHLSAVRVQSPFYVHEPLSQGHTERGQVLGSIGAHGGGAAELSLTEYSQQGEWTIGWSRIMRGNPRTAATLPSSGDADVLQALAAERMFFRQSVDIGVRLTAVLESNRDPGSTAANFNVTVKAKAHW